MQQVALLLAQAAARALTPQELERAIVALDSLEPEELDRDGEGMPREVLNMLRFERRQR